MNVTLAKSAGFCYGVKRAVEMAEERAGAGVYMLGHITHNDHVIDHLERLGARTVLSVEEVPQGADVLIRAHGEPERTYRALEEKGCRIFDATCPNVSRIHRIVAQAEEQGRVPVIVGDPDHPSYELSCKQTSGFGAMISFRVDSNERLKRVLERVNVILLSGMI